jgi:glycosyltransferase involved in cell wall biosynthesis
MNILIAISSLNYGGAEKQAVLDANMLAVEHKVVLLVFNNGPLEKILHDNVQLILLKKGNYLATACRVRKVIKNYDIDFVHASLNAAMLISALAAILSKTKVFWHYHSHEFELPALNIILFQILGKMSVIKKILFVNRELLLFISKRFGFPENKLDILYNTSSFIHENHDKYESDIACITYIGRLVELKRVNYLILLADFLVKNRISEFKILIIGDGDQRIILEKYSEQKNLKNYIHFEGFRTELEHYYDRTDIFVLPSREECLSMAMIDAGMKGIPSVAFDVGGNNEIIENGKTGFIVKTETEFFIKVNSLINDKTLREQMGEEARKYCLKHFSEEIHLKKLESLHRELIV